MLKVPQASLLLATFGVAKIQTGVVIQWGKLIPISQEAVRQLINYVCSQ